MTKALSLKTKLNILAAIPLLCAVGFGIKLTHERVADMREFSSFSELMTLANHYAEINELNSGEMGRVWCYTPTCIDENGIEVVEGIRKEYDDVGSQLDAKWQEMVSFRETMDLTAYDPGILTIL